MCSLAVRGTTPPARSTFPSSLHTPSATRGLSPVSSSSQGCHEFSDSCSSASSPAAEAWAADDQSCGLWSLLPGEVVEAILNNCSPIKLAMLQSTCKYFRSCSLIEKIAKHSLKAVPRARSLKPSTWESETYLALLQFINHQSAAAAQATAIACGSHHTAALLIEQASASEPSTSGHSLYTFGRNLHGQLGCSDYEDHATPSAVNLGFQPCLDNANMEEETIPAVVSCGAHYSMSMSRRGELFSWGLGRSGELGQGPWSQLGTPVPRQTQLLQRVRVVSVACGASHTLAIGESGALWCCGSNSRGQLGNGSLIGSCNLQPVQNLPGTRIVSAAAGATHSVALTSDGSLYTWGDGSHGQLGHEQLQIMAAPRCQNTIILPLPQKVATLDPTMLAPENRVTAISAGSYHTMVLLVGGGILAFGFNETGCLGLGDNVNRWAPTKVHLALEGEERLCIRAVALSCGAAHTLALVSKQGSLELRSTGANTWGQLGLGDTMSRCEFTPSAPIWHVCAIQAGAEHSAAVTENGSVFLWGRGDSGQLGQGDQLSRSWPTLLKGYAAVHPDKTLRRSKRNMPMVRPSAAVGHKSNAVLERVPIQ